jgi:nanoRNase/pAp phosphatase (c-di-AMP/oligoRNAs hydrolase)
MPEIDFVMMINPSYAISYRTNKDIDLTVIAKEYGGGGHIKASGNSIPLKLKEQIIDLLLDKENYAR